MKINHIEMFSTLRKLYGNEQADKRELILIGEADLSSIDGIDDLKRNLSLIMNERLAEERVNDLIRSSRIFD